MQPVWGGGLCGFLAHFSERSPGHLAQVAVTGLKSSSAQCFSNVKHSSQNFFKDLKGVQSLFK